MCADSANQITTSIEAWGLPYWSGDSELPVIVRLSPRIPGVWIHTLIKKWKCLKHKTKVWAIAPSTGHGLVRCWTLLYLCMAECPCNKFVHVCWVWTLCRDHRLLGVIVLLPAYLLYFSCVYLPSQHTCLCTCVFLGMSWWSGQGVWDRLSDGFDRVVDQTQVLWQSSSSHQPPLCPRREREKDRQSCTQSCLEVDLSRKTVCYRMLVAYDL